MSEGVDLKLLSIGGALWIGAASKGLLHSYWLIFALPIFFLIGKKFGSFILIVALVGSFNIGLHQIALSHNALRPFMENKSEITLVVQVKTDPKLGASKVVGSTLRPASTSFLAASIRINGGKVRLPLRITTPSRVSFVPGTVIEFNAIVYATQEKAVAALVVARGSFKTVHGPSVIGRVTSQIRRSFKEQVSRLSGDGAWLIPGLVLGDTSLETPSFIVEMRRSGLTHLTAVSGENFAIISAFILWMMQWIIKKLRT